tara:strand:- start:31 stop:279 length:249 start_codon:yes stop_codon:yes gene_type:complete
MNETQISIGSLNTARHAIAACYGHNGLLPSHYAPLSNSNAGIAYFAITGNNPQCYKQLTDSQKHLLSCVKHLLQTAPETNHN